MSSRRSGGQTTHGVAKKKGSDKRRNDAAKATVQWADAGTNHYAQLEHLYAVKVKAVPDGGRIGYTPNVLMVLKTCEQIYAHHWSNDTLKVARGIVDECLIKKVPLDSVTCAIKFAVVSNSSAAFMKSAANRCLRYASNDDAFVARYAEMLDYHPNSIDFAEVCVFAHALVVSMSSANNSQVLVERIRKLFAHLMYCLQLYNMDILLGHFETEIIQFTIAARLAEDEWQYKLNFLRPETYDYEDADGQINKPGPIMLLK